MSEYRNTLIDLLCRRMDPSAVAPNEWSAIVATARATNLLGSLGEILKSRGGSTHCNADRHLEGARQLSERQRRSVRWEGQCLQNALAGLGEPILLLKGAAYVMGKHPNRLGRLFGDIDVLVPPEVLGAVEINLMVNGWTSASTSSYDQRYYREWMHELPPFVHVRRGTVLDVHHTILPPTARHKPNARQIIRRAAPLPELPALYVPCPEDLVIHSITHLVHEGELHNGLRDLFDIHLLISSQSSNHGFWHRLTEYTVEHGLQDPVLLGIRLVRRYFGTEIPGNFLLDLRGSKPVSDNLDILDRLYDLALTPHVNRRRNEVKDFADFLLYVRAHWLRMPPGLLLRHLSRKTITRFQTKDSKGGHAPTGELP